MKKNMLALMAGVLFAAVLPVVSQNWDRPDEKYADAYKAYENAPLPIPSDDSVKNYVYFARDRDAVRNHTFLRNPRFEGAQIMYSWAQLEKQKDQYDFSSIQEDYEYLAANGKKLFVQLQDATFDPAYKGVPEYLFADEYGGGAVLQLYDDGTPNGWVAKRWNAAVRARFALLLNALGKQFDGKITGINLQETAIGVSQETDSTFTPQAYAEGLKENMNALKAAFKTSVPMLYANFMPGEWLPWDDKGLFRSLYAHGEKIGVSLGAPDLMVQKKGQLNHAITLMHEGTFTVPLGIAVQDGNYIGQTNDDTVQKERKNLVPMLYYFAKDFLRVQYIFWVNQAPYFEEDVLAAFAEE